MWFTRISVKYPRFHHHDDVLPHGVGLGVLAAYGGLIPDVTSIRGHLARSYPGA